MFDVAFSELVIIGMIALIVLGPKRLPEVARAAGRWMGKVRNFVESAKRDMHAEMRRDELAELRKVKDQLVETKHAFEQAATGTINAVSDLQSPGAGVANALSSPVEPKPLSKPRKRPAMKKKKKTASIRKRPRSKKHG